MKKLWPSPKFRTVSRLQTVTKMRLLRSAGNNKEYTFNDKEYAGNYTVEFIHLDSDIVVMPGKAGGLNIS
ncbi:hypothetical protein ACFLTQ_02685 [Chloroflexota bacterium]